MTPHVLSPLRYPGSKQKVIKKIEPYWEAISKMTHEYREPFLGGASIFLNLNTEGKTIWLNDKDKNISTFFKVVKDYPREFCELVNKCSPSIKVWKEMRYSEPKDDLNIAFKTFFLNRTNYSGILNANPIGGYRQKSEYPIDCRWNKEDLVMRIMTSSKLLKDAEITFEDFFYVFIKPSRFNIFFMIDPPYYHKGNSLYEKTMSPDDHKRLRDLLANTEHKFLLTYDNCEEIIDLYKGIPGLYFEETGWYYTTSTASPDNGRQVGKEIFISNINVSSIIQKCYHKRVI